MSRLDELPPDQRAALTILLSRHKSYAEVGKLLGISDQAVHDRAHAALAMLAPRQARALSAAQREEIGEYLLGQQTRVAESLRTRTYLGSSEPARAWALALARELGPLVDGALPEIPAPASAAAPPSAPVPAPAPGAAPAAGEPAEGSPGGQPATGAGARAGSGLPRSSRTGGAILLVLLLAGVVVAVALLSGGSSGHKAAATTAKTATAGTPAVTARLPLRSPNPHSRSVGLVDILQEGSKRAFYIAAEHLPPTRGFFYAIWLYNSPRSFEPLSRAPAVGANRRLEGGALLPSNARKFHTMLLTRETKSHPSHPGKVVLRGRFKLRS